MPMKNDSEIDKLIELTLNESERGSEAFEAAMKSAGEAMARSFVDLDRSVGKTFAIVTPAQDREFLALGFASALQAHGARVTISTLWNKFIAAKGFVSSTTLLLAQHHQAHPEKVDRLVYVSSSLAEDSTIADNLSRMLKITKPSEHLVLVLTASKKEMESVEEQFRLRDCPLPQIKPLEGDLSFDRPSRGAAIRTKLRDHLFKAYGRKGLGYVPQSLGGPKPTFGSEFTSSGPGW
ncbi:hypothetical protein ACC721_05635 [Rhizobium ruizarguesonis]